jgi:hypothetical protein
MTTIINGSSPSITFSDSTTQASAGLTSSSTLNASNVTTGTLPYAQLPAGSVLQVVQTSSSTTVSTTSTTFADTGITVTITPKFTSSKILVLAHPNGLYSNASGYGVNTRIVRDSTPLAVIDTIAGYSNAGSNGAGGASISYLDSPSTTSATIYKVQYASGNGGLVYVNASNGGQSVSYITVMEIAG